MVHTFAPDGSSMTVDIIQRDGPVLKSVTLPQRRQRQQQPVAAAAASSTSRVKGTGTAARLRALQE